MKTQPVLVALTLVNLTLFIVALTPLARAAPGDQAVPVLRGRALEIVDQQGKVRASIRVYPASSQKGGEIYPETVLLRLITERGRPSVKLSASEPLSGLALVGMSGTKQTYAQLGARGTASSLTLKNEDGRERVVAP